VGRCIGESTMHICDDEGNELPPRGEGMVFFNPPRPFEYHNDPDKTASSRNKHGWSTLGDVGWVDEDGYLFLTDRKSFMIISGGVNVYPQEIENHLVTHPAVADVAVVGAPHDEMGEQVVAVIQPVAGVEPGEALAQELTAFCRQFLSGVKIPRRFDFVEELPRHATGKLYKRLIRDRYWGKESLIV
jgi:acyl-CoA synthetase (AMP-forming)/AMP-acid ligase II